MRRGILTSGPLDRGEGTRREICMALEEMGFEIEASHHEVAAGQHEIDFKYADALKAADNIMTFKLAVKTTGAEKRTARHIYAEADLRNQRIRNAYKYVTVPRRQKCILR